MKKLFALIAVFGLLLFSVSSNAIAQEEGDTTATQLVDSTSVEADTLAATMAGDDVIAEPEKTGFHQELKRLFIEGGPEFMTFVLLALILGMAFAIERIIYLTLASTNTKRLLENIEAAMEEGGIEAAKEVCRNQRGPVASIFYQGLLKYNEGIDMVEKSVIGYGSVQAGLLEKNLSWIGLFISLAPMLGFMGTVIGMISAFDSIQQAGDVSASLVAGGIKVALITTVSGLVVAIILQIFYNYLLSKIDGIVNSMEDASISLIDILVKYNLKK